MDTNIVLTLTGPDRVGLVEAVTKPLLERGGNVETSRMARLGGAFAILMLATIPEEQIAGLPTALDALIAQGYKLTLSRTEPAAPPSALAWTLYRVEVRGADQEGIIHHIAQTLAKRGINIESMDTVTNAAAMSGTPLFAMTANIAVPPNLAGHDWQAALDQVGREMNVDITLTPGV
jgi:glycine cleavage system transcriptional repressor